MGTAPTATQVTREGAPEDSTSLAPLTRVVGPHLRRRALVLGLIGLLQIIETAATLTLPAVTAAIIDDGVVQQDQRRILSLGGIMVAVSVLQVVALVAVVYLVTRTGTAVGRDLREATFRRVVDFSTREVARFGAPSLLTRSINDVSQVQIFIITTFTLMIPAPLLAVGGVALAVMQDALLSSLFVVALLLLGVVVGVVLTRLAPLARARQRRVDDVNRIVRENLSGIRVVRAFVREAYERGRFREVSGSVASLGVRLGRLMALVVPVLFLSIDVSAVGILWFGGRRVDAGEMTIGSLVAFLHYVALILGSALLAAFAALTLPAAVVSAARIDEVLRTEPSVLPPHSPVTPRGTGTVEFRQVEYGRPGAQGPILQSVSLTARPGRWTAVAGPTSSGKSTLLNLVPRLADVTGGAVLVDDVDVRQITPGALSARVGLVSQRAHLFAGTIASNLRLGDPDAEDDRLWRALDVAQARDVVEAMPGGLDERVGPGGAGLSGGQRQRLAIARVLVARPQVYLFDDAFSALDHPTEAAVLEALADEITGGTVIVVSQRVAPLLRADEIVLLDGGRVVDIGDHTSLLARSATYRDLVLAQLPEEPGR